jgi:cell division protein FtsQ
MSRKTNDSNPAARSWKEIDQAVAGRKLSSKGRMRLFTSSGNTLLLVLLAAVVGWGVWEIRRTVHGGGGAGGSSVTHMPLKEVVLITDGVLTQDWLNGALAIPANSSLMELDLFALRDRLLRNGQVAGADLRREFPDTLVVSLQERAPVLRAIVQESGVEPRSLLIARDGVAYEGSGYDSLMVNALPFLDGVKLVRGRDGFVPVEGMAEVSDMISAAQNNAPHLFRSWRVVSLARLRDYNEIVVRTRDIPEIVFNRRQDFTRQLARLDYIVDYTRTQSEATVRKVDLSIGSQVPVELHAAQFVKKTSAQPINRNNRRDF